MALHIIDHPLIQHKITMIRDIRCGTKQFREIVEEISALMVYESTRHLELNVIEVTTPISLAEGYELKKPIVIVPILRAGLGMTQGIQHLIPSIKIAHIGMYRDKETLKPQLYYAKFPDSIKDSKTYILDPLLATGGSILEAIRILKNKGVTDLTVLSIIGVMEGVEKILDEHPDVEIYLGNLDEKLNEHAYIVPGLGDAGDRLFGTK